MNPESCRVSVCPCRGKGGAENKVYLDTLGLVEYSFCQVDWSREASKTLTYSLQRLTAWKDSKLWGSGGMIDTLNIVQIKEC